MSVGHGMRSMTQPLTHSALRLCHESQHKVAYGWGAILLRGERQGTSHCMGDCRHGGAACRMLPASCVSSRPPLLQACWATGSCAWPCGSECLGARPQCSAGLYIHVRHLPDSARWAPALLHACVMAQATVTPRSPPCRGNMARDFAGKAIGVWLPDAAFVSMVRAAPLAITCS